jgi:hypothetical protein
LDFGLRILDWKKDTFVPDERAAPDAVFQSKIQNQKSKIFPPQSLALSCPG